MQRRGIEMARKECFILHGYNLMYYIYIYLA